MNWFQKIRSLFGVQYIMFVHHDGEHTIHKATYMFNAWYAYPYLPDTRCKLLCGGDVIGESYITRWEPITKKVQDYYRRKENTCIQEPKF